MKKEQIVVRYSTAFKAEVVEQIRSGQLSIAQAREKYGIVGGTTVYRWVHQAGRHDLIRKVVKVSTSKEVDELRRLKKELAQAKRALADLQIDNWYNNEMYQLACEKMGVDPNEFKKKVEAGLLARPNR